MFLVDLILYTEANLKSDNFRQKMKTFPQKQLITISPKICWLGKGAEKKIRISYGLFTDKKIYPHFFWKIESMIAKTNFTLGPIEKFIFFVKL